MNDDLLTDTENFDRKHQHNNRNISKLSNNCSDILLSN